MYIAEIHPIILTDGGNTAVGVCMIIETKRLILRLWKTQDIQVYFEINQDEKVIEFLPGSLNIDSIEHFICTQNKQGAKKGFMLWAAELKATRELIGFIGLNTVGFEAHFTPAVEIGWRLGSPYWDKGYATEGAKASLEFGFTRCSLDTIVAFTATDNVRSRKVMERCGMIYNKNGGFSHPRLPKSHRLSRHVLYSMTKNEWF